MPILALIQMRVEPGQPARNLERAALRIAEAARAGAAVVLLPEALDFGWTHPSARTGAEPIPEGVSYRALQRAAQEAQVFVCAGLVERESDRFFNSAVLISPDGARLLHHRKIHELEIAQNLYSRGDRLQTVVTPFGPVGMMICADAFVPGLVISRTLGCMGARLILSPCAWAVPADHDNHATPYGQLWLESYCPVARESNLTIAGASNVGWITDGPWRGRKCIGSSLVVGPDGAELARAPYGEDAEAILYVDLP
jgi:predicted amidohydrolase